MDATSRWDGCNSHPRLKESPAQAASPQYKPVTESILLPDPPVYSASSEQHVRRLAVFCINPPRHSFPIAMHSAQRQFVWITRWILTSQRSSGSIES